MTVVVPLSDNVFKCITMAVLEHLLQKNRITDSDMNAPAGSARRTLRKDIGTAIVWMCWRQGQQPDA